MWEAADGKTSIEALAQRMQLPVETVQQIAFRMKMAGLVVIVSLVANEPKQQVETTPLAGTANNDTGANQSLMKNLVNLLNTKIV